MILIRGVIGPGGCEPKLGGVPTVGGKWERAEGEGWQLEFSLDRSGRSMRSQEGLLIHDGRVDDFAGALKERSGSWLQVDWSQAGQLVFATDRLGTIPIYWGLRDGRAFFASRLIDMVRFGFDSPDALGVMQMVMLNQSTGVRTVLEGVSLLPCASTVALSVQGTSAASRYWTPFVTDEAVANEQQWLDEGLEVIREANRKAVRTAIPGKVAWPLTGGLDSRGNSGCCADLIGPDDLFFHVEDMGDFELPIARRLANVYGKTVREFHSSKSMREAARSDLDLDSGDLNVGHWRLRGTAQELAEELGYSSTVDGFLQGILMNPGMFFHEGTVADARERCFKMASFRAEMFKLDLQGAPFRQFREDYEATFPGGRHGLDASQQFIMENRSRRMVFGIVRLNANYLDVRTPGMDSGLIDYAMRLPWSLRKGAIAYKKIIGMIDPRLAAIDHDKTGLPLTAGAEVSRKRKIAKYVTYYVNRVWPGEPLLKGKETAFERMLRADEAFRTEVYDVISGSRWIEEIFGRDIIKVVEGQRLSRGLSFDGVGALLTIALLEKAGKDQTRK
ncbi:hypothetical protein [Thauera sp. Sel9]|uniref:hypothetical protein n=1 Tax=Thauera sp. Sel9 TaxID=2974299 RepID=UPI0021E13925|nr:hypothetical protein [Thauera sp. Sel9]MCV2217533.1 hypothetical protein [Thauera sp. Sel9]